MDNKFNNIIGDKLEYYVYRLIDPRNGETFYIGKGKGNRVFEHANQEISLKNSEEDGSDEISQKIETIKEIKNANLDVLYVIHRHGMTEEIALEVEAALIDAYPGITNINSGVGSERGVMSVQQIIYKYDMPTVEFKHNVMLIKINKNYNQMSVYDATRYAWVVNLEKAKKVDYVVSVYRGVIKGVYVVNEWKKATKENFPEYHNESIDTRYGFMGEEAPAEILALYLNKRVPDSYLKKGASNPIQYNLIKRKN